MDLSNRVTHPKKKGTSMTSKFATTQYVTDLLKKDIVRDTNFLAKNGPCEGMSVITDGDYLVSTGDETGPFIVMQRDNDGNLYMPPHQPQSCMYRGTKLTKKNAQIIADHISEHPNRNGKPCIVVKMWHAVQTRLEKNTNLRRNLLAEMATKG